MSTPAKEKLGLEGEVGALREVTEDLRLDVRRLHDRILGNGEGLVTRVVKLEQWVLSCQRVSKMILAGILILAAEAVHRWFG